MGATIEAVPSSAQEQSKVGLALPVETSGNDFYRKKRNRKWQQIEKKLSALAAVQGKEHKWIVGAGFSTSL